MANKPICRALRKVWRALVPICLGTVVIVGITIFGRGNLVYMTAASLGGTIVVMAIVVTVWRGEDKGDTLVWAFWGASFSSEVLLAIVTGLLFSVYGNTPSNDPSINFLVENFWYMPWWEYLYLIFSQVVLLFAYEWLKAYLLTRRSSGRRYRAAA
jgi:ABC-type Fe3+-siderophore transport system permease subunit